MRTLPISAIPKAGCVSWDSAGFFIGERPDVWLSPGEEWIDGGTDKSISPTEAPRD